MPALVDDAALDVRDHAAALVERDARQRDAAVADAPQDDAARDRLALAGRDRADLAALVGDERVADDLDRLDLPVAEDRDRRDENRSTSRRGLPSGTRAAYSREQVDVAARGRAVLGERGLARRVEHEVGRIDDDVGAGELAELLQLRVRERRLRRPAAAEHHDLAEPGADDRLDRGVGRVGRRELLGVSASIRATSTATLPFPTTIARSPERSNSRLLEVGMAVVPGDEGGRGPRAGQVLAGDAHPPVGLGADRVDDRVVERSSSAGLTSWPTSTLPKKRKPGSFAVFSNTRETALISGWSGATPRRTSPHGVGSRSIRSTSAPRGEQRRGSVEPGRAGADHGDAQLCRSPRVSQRQSGKG